LECKEGFFTTRKHQKTCSRKCEEKRRTKKRQSAALARIANGRKQCKTCGETKSFSSFHRKTRSLDGYQSSCKQCAAKKAKQYHQTPEVKKKAADYNSRPEVQERERERYKTPEYKKKQAEYRRRPEIREKERERKRTPEYKKVAKGYFNRPEIRERENKRQNEYYKTPEKKKKAKDYRSRPEIRERKRERERTPEYRKKAAELRRRPAAREKVNAWYRQRLRKDPRFALIKRVKNLLRTCLNRYGGPKQGRTFEDILPYNEEDLIERLKNTIPEGYVWEDCLAGNGKLHIDHIVPIKAHNFKTQYDLDFKNCWALSNLRLYPAKDNMKKGAKLNEPFQPSLALAINPKKRS